jgi:hypothetical protein
LREAYRRRGWERTSVVSKYLGRLLESPRRLANRLLVAFILVLVGIVVDTAARAALLVVVVCLQGEKALAAHLSSRIVVHPSHGLTDHRHTRR